MVNVGEVGESVSGLPGIGDVALDVVDWMVGDPGRPRPASDAVHFPWSAGCVVERENLGETVADDTSHADDQCYAVVLGRSIVGV